MQSIHPSESGDLVLIWDDPAKVGVLVNDSDGSTYYRGPGLGTSTFLTHDRARSRNFIKGGDAFFLLTFEGRYHQTVLFSA